MNTPAKLGAYGLVLAVALGGGAAVGGAVGPIDADGGDDPPAGEHDTHDSAATGETGDADAEHSEELMPAGLSVTADGYTLVADDTVVEAPASDPFLFRITGPDGEVVREFEPRHERDLHLVVVSADLSTYAHVHPTRADDGTWSVTDTPVAFCPPLSLSVMV